MQKLKPVKEIQPEYFLKKKRNHFLISSFVNSMTSLGLVYSAKNEVEIILWELQKLLAATLGPFDFFLSPFDFFLPFVWFLKLVECAFLVMK